MPLQEKKVLFYTTTAEKNSSLLPLQMLITEDHSAHNIGYHLKNFKLECIDHKIWPIFRKVVIDFAKALLIALNYAYNDFNPNLTALQYYNYCYNVQTSKDKLKKNFIVVQGCCAHFAKIVSKDLAKFAPKLPKNTKHLIQEAMAYASTTSDLKTQGIWWERFCIVFGSKKKSTFVQEELSKLFKMINYSLNSHPESKYRDSNVEHTDIHTTSNEKTIYESSPFYKHFKNISDRIKPLLNLDTLSENEYYVDGLHEHFLKKYMYDTCFWTNSMGCLVESGGE